MSGKVNVIREDGRLAFCKVVESLGYNHDAGAYCKIVQLDGSDVLVKRARGLKLWRQHTAAERIEPLVEWTVQHKAKREEV